MTVPHIDHTIPILSFPLFIKFHKKKLFEADSLIICFHQRLNDVIAFKMIEISERYTPELSEYKEGRVIHIQVRRRHNKLICQG